MQKTLALFICLIFSNTSFAIPGWFSPDQARCKVNYTRLNLITGAETNIKHTVQYTDRDSFDRNCSDADDPLSEKIKKWVKKSKHNIAVDVTAIYCKRRTDDGIFSNTWSDYKICSANHIRGLIFRVKISYPNQIGYNLNGCRFIGITEEELNTYDCN
jgi:hypothetical protein